MDNLTHTLFGATLGRTPLGRAGRGTTATLILASNAPDIDIVAAAGGALQYLEWHRGPTHGPIGIVLLGMASAGMVWLAHAIRARRTQSGSGASPPNFPALVVAGMVGVVFHVLMDLPTSNGTRALSPFSWTWFAWDWMPIIDIYRWITLATCLLFGRGSAAARRRNVAIAITIMAGIYGVRGVAHQRAIATAPRVFGPILPAPCPGVAPQSFVDRWPRPPAGADPEGGRCLIEIAAMPDFVSPFHWRLVAHVSNAYESQRINVLDRRYSREPAATDAAWRRTLREPNQWTPAVSAAAASQVGRVFLGFSRFPAARTSLERDGSIIVRWSDMRYIPPGLPRNSPARRGSFFSATVRVGADGSILEQRLGP